MVPPLRHDISFSGLIFRHQDMLSGVVSTSFFLVVGEIQLCNNSKGDYFSCLWKSTLGRIAPSEVMDEVDKTRLNTTHDFNVRVLDRPLSAEVF